MDYAYAGAFSEFINAEEIVVTFRQLFDKWKELTDDVDDTATLAQLY